MAPECDGYEYGSAMKMILVLLLGYLIMLLVRTVDTILGKRPGDPLPVPIILLYMAEKGLPLLKSQRQNIHLANRDYQLALLNFGVMICYVLSLRLQNLKKSNCLDMASSTILILNKAVNSFPSPPPFVVQNYIIISLAIVNWVVLVLRSFLVPLQDDLSCYSLPELRKNREDLGIRPGLRGGGDEENVQGPGVGGEDIYKATASWVADLSTVRHVGSWLSISNRSWLDFTSHTCSLLATGVLVEAVAESFLFPEDLGFHICESNGFLYSQLLLPFLLVLTLTFFSMVLVRWSIPLYIWQFEKRNKCYCVVQASKADAAVAGGGASRPDLKRFATDVNAAGEAGRPDVKRFASDLVDGDKDRYVVREAMFRTHRKLMKDVEEPKQYDRPKHLIRLLGLSHNRAATSSSPLIKMAPDPHPARRDDGLPMCWTLRAFTLKTIAIALPGEPGVIKDLFLRGVYEGLYYAKLADDLDLLLPCPDPLLLKMKEAALLDCPPLLRWWYHQRLHLHRWFNMRWTPSPPPTIKDRWLGFDIGRIRREAKTAEEALTRLKALAYYAFMASYDNTRGGGGENDDAARKFSTGRIKNPVSWSPRDFAAYSMYTNCKHLLDHLRRKKKDDGHRCLTTADEAMFQQAVQVTISEFFRNCISQYPLLAVDKLSSSSSMLYPSQRSIGRVFSTLAGMSKLRDTEWVKAESRSSSSSAW